MSTQPSNAVPASLEQFFRTHTKVALAFSGGVDSAYLLYAAVACGADVNAYYVHTQFQPAFELADARRLAVELNARCSVVELNILAHGDVAANPPDRCYHCKRALFGALIERARADGYAELLDGTNASDDSGDRPGMRALTELRVLSPLRACGITKAEVRALSRRAGLFTWDKPAYACLATRIPAGTAITEGALEAVERAEVALAALGFADFRVRVLGGGAKLQLTADQFPMAVKRRAEILAALTPDFTEVLLDMRGREGA